MIHYSVVFDEESKLEFAIDEEGDSSAETAETEVPAWVELEAYRCERCSLPVGSRRSCPAALSIKGIVEDLAARISYERVELTVEREEVTLTASIAIQQAARSIIGLVLPLSACPVMKQLRPMARLHLPLGKRQHTAFRFLGMYFVAQYVKQQQGQDPDWELEGLRTLLADIHMVNHRLTERIRASSSLDATVNALVALDFFANNVEWNIEDSLEELLPLFAPLLDH